MEADLKSSKKAPRKRKPRHQDATDDLFLFPTASPAPAPEPAAPEPAAPEPAAPEPAAPAAQPPAVQTPAQPAPPPPAELPLSPAPAAEPAASALPEVPAVAATPEISAAPEAPSTPATLPPPAPAAAKPQRNAARDLVVSIHDVSPLTREATEAMIGELRELGVGRITLLVIPDHHRKGHLLDYPEFCAWLRDRVAQGDEVAIHGYFHRRDQRPGETFHEKLATRFYTAGEGEFYDIAGADALRLISQARQEFRKAGIDPCGFVAPAWLLSDGADRALQRLGLTYTTRIGGIFDYATGVQHLSQSLVWSSRSWWRRLLSLAWNAYLFRRLRGRNLLRIGIHPTDRPHRAIWKQIKALIAKALKDRSATTYSGYLQKR